MLDDRESKTHTILGVLFKSSVHGKLENYTCFDRLKVSRVASVLHKPQGAE
jgi:hypothetical protein